VIVTNRAREVSALAGDDLICVDRAPNELIKIVAGVGNDATFVTDRQSHVSYRAGFGSDSYYSTGSSDDAIDGGPGEDFADGGPGPTPASPSRRRGTAS
jgi:hypothetical protein